MDSHIEVDEGLKRSRDLMDAVRKGQTALDELKRQKEIMSKMLDGDGSDASHFVKHVALYGLQGADASAKQAKAKTLFDELNSTVGNIHASLPQFLAILG